MIRNSNHIIKTFFNTFLLVLLFFAVAIIILFIDALGFLIITILSFMLILFKWERLNDLFKNLENERLLTFVLVVVIALILFIISFFVEYSFIDEYFFLEIFFLEIILLVIFILVIISLKAFSHLEKYEPFQLVCASKQSMVFRVLFAYSIILSFSPYASLLVKKNLFISEIESILILNLFFLSFLLCLMPITGVIRIGLESSEKEIMTQDLIKTVFSFFIFIILILININVTTKFYPNFFSEVQARLSPEYSGGVGIWQIILCGVIIFTIIIFQMFGFSSLKILNDLSLQDTPDLPKKFGLLALIGFFIIFISFFLLADIISWVIVTIILLEILYLWFMVIFFEKAPEKTFLLKILVLISNIIISIMILSAIHYFFIESLYEIIFILFLPLVLLVFNYLLMNRLFINFNFIDFLKRSINTDSGVIEGSEAVKLIIIESLDFLPNKQKHDHAREIVSLLKETKTEEMSSSIKKQLKEYKTRYQGKITEGDKWSLDKKLSILLHYLRIFVYHYDNELPLRYQLPHEFLLVATTLKFEDFNSLGIIIHTFFEGFIKSVRKDMGLKIDNTTGKRDADVDNIVLSGEKVVGELKLKITDKIREIRDNRNIYVHRKREELENISITGHYNNFILVLNCTLQVLEKFT